MVKKEMPMRQQKLEYIRDIYSLKALSSICFASQVNISCIQDNSTGKQDKSND